MKNIRDVLALSLTASLAVSTVAVAQKPIAAAMMRRGTK